MRKFIAAVLLFALVAVATTLSMFAQTRVRRVEQQPKSPTPAQGSSRQTTQGGTRTTTVPVGETADEVGEDEVVRVNTALVTIPVSVTDRDGRYIADLRQSDFRIYEDGDEQEIAYFATVEKPFTVALVLDTSNSTKFKLEEIQDAAIAFVGQLRPEDRVLVVSFDDKVKVLAEPTGDRRVLREAIRRTRTGGSTKLYDAVDLVIKDQISRIKGRKAIVLFTDGVDTSSNRATYESNVSDAEELDAIIYPVEYDTFNDMGGGNNGGGGGGGSRGGDDSTITIGGIRIPLPFPRGGGVPPIVGGGGGGTTGNTRGEYVLGQRYLRALADKTGGRVHTAYDLRYLEQAFSDIAEELRRQYSLGYYPKRQAQETSRRLVRVRVNRPNLAVRARDSYIYKPSGGATTTAQDDRTRQPELRKRQFASSTQHGTIK